MWFVFWVLTVGVHAVVNSVMTTIEWWGTVSRHDPDSWRGMVDVVAIAVALGYGIYTIIVWVGLWRSAGRYPGRRIWRFLARFTVVAGIAFAITAITAEILFA